MTHIFEENISTAMRDGTILRCDIFRPDAPGQYPVLVSRTPYDKTRTAYRRIAAHMANNGYVCILQDIRGTHASDGTYYLARNGRQDTRDAEDGYDTVEWAAALPCSDGQVCVWGHSYSSWSAWVAAGARPPSLKALFGSGMAARILDNTRGIFETGRRLHWMYQQAADMRRRAGGPALTKAEIDARWYDVERFKWVWFLPLGDIPDSAFPGLTDQLKDYMRKQTVETWGFDDVHPDVTVPTCALTGWYDRIIGAIEHYEGMEANGPADLRGQHRLIVGPWGHGMAALNQHVGPMDFGPDAAALYEDLLLEWCDEKLKGRTPVDPAPVRLFVMGENRWHSAQQWPLAGTRHTDFFLRSQGQANSVAGDGRLELAPPQDDPADQFTYDPRDPVMSLMGRDIQMEPRLQAPNDDRQDILVYQTAPLDRPLRVIGRVSVELWIGSDAPDTDFTVKLVDVRPDGSAVNVSYGILRCRYRDGYAADAAPLRPDRSYRIRIELNPTAIVFGAGHRIRLDVSSSDFPNFDRNHNTGRDFWSDAELRPARQSVFHDHKRASRLVLPVIDNTAG
ncbi:CocE/NonD family hydrolase [Roseinatronobacter sp. NSM]|uniref:CocE/NonD family hydrolase n=1 Tax=Roseinatronobacter sp. NSM TaxID=3457785 RepID=UPI004036843F